MASNRDRSSATWSCDDVATLVHTLADEKAKGNWVDNRPQGVAWTSCEHAFLDSERKSGGGVKTLQSIQNSWNDQEKCVRASREVWDAYVKTHPMANKFRKKPFLLYDTIAYLVDDTQATGKNAFRADQKSAFEHERSLPWFAPQVQSQRGRRAGHPESQMHDRKRSQSPGTTANGRQKIRRVSVDQGISEITASSMRNMTDAQTQTTR
ncbi:hypothetical protein V8E53_011753 [Lactarius tabidus]